MGSGSVRAANVRSTKSAADRLDCPAMSSGRTLPYDLWAAKRTMENASSDKMSAAQTVGLKTLVRLYQGGSEAG